MQSSNIYRGRAFIRGRSVASRWGFVNRRTLCSWEVAEVVLGEELAEQACALELVADRELDLVHQRRAREVDYRGVRAHGALDRLLGPREEEVRVVRAGYEEEVRAAAQLEVRQDRRRGHRFKVAGIARLLLLQQEQVRRIFQM